MLSVSGGDSCQAHPPFLFAAAPTLIQRSNDAQGAQSLPGPHQVLRALLPPQPSASPFLQPREQLLSFIPTPAVLVLILVVCDLQAMGSSGRIKGFLGEHTDPNNILG